MRNFYHLTLAFLSSVFYHNPSREIFVIGVTGTKGKSTVLELINVILETAGYKTALLSSVRRKVGLQSEPNLTGNTMPGRFTIQKFLADAVKARVNYVLVEVTSQGVIQHRHRFIEWDAAIFINLAPEHIEAHGSFENYRNAKLGFFHSLTDSKKPTKYFFINEADSNRHYFEEAARRTLDARIEFFSRERFIKEDLGSHYNLKAKPSREFLADWFLADFNLENAAAAASFARSQKIKWPIIKKAFDDFKGVPGRLEFIQKKPFTVVIDYAHTPDSLRQVYEAVRPEALNYGSKGELICVLGSAGGGRDKWKRPEMGKIAATHCDKIILTNEDPYDEEPIEILKQIENGFLNAGLAHFKPDNHWHVLDRRAAIKKALGLAEKGDVVVITGKGSEPWLHLAHGQKISWNERRVVEECLEDVKK